jgi:hypothetical protein
VTKLHRPSTLLLATLILWTVAYAGWTAGWMLDPMPFALERAMRRIPLCLFGAALCLAIGHVLDRQDARSTARLVTTAAIAVFAATLVHALLNELVFYVLVPRWGGAAWQHIPDVMMSDFWVYVAWVLLYFALAADAGRRDREVQLAQASAQAIDAQHKLLVQQTNPHFLFNALNTVYALMLENDDGGARRSLLALSSFLRRSLQTDAALFVPLSLELESARDYLKIQTARFGERLRLVERVPEQLLAHKVPNLILQPLIENCVKHGMQGLEDEEPVTITLTAGIERGLLFLSVENDGAAAAAPTRRGVGLSHVARRLHLLYGGAARLDARPRGSGGFEARIELPEKS